MMGHRKRIIYGGSLIVFVSLLTGCSTSQIEQIPPQEILARSAERMASLAENATYSETWQAFPAGSVPYLYVDMPGLMDFIADSMGTSSDGDLQAIRSGVRKMPVIAAAMNNTPGYVSSSTMIIFIETGQ